MAENVQDEPAAIEGRGDPEAPRLEGAQILANQARDTLQGQGLDDDEILALAERFVREHEEGSDLDTFLSWVRSRVA